MPFSCQPCDAKLAGCNGFDSLRSIATVPCALKGLTEYQQRDGIQFASTGYVSPVLAAYVGEHVTVRYDPRDVGEIRIYFNDGYLCRLSPRSWQPSQSCSFIQPSGVVAHVLRRPSGRARRVCSMPSI